jgi:hypothetical protein
VSREEQSQAVATQDWHTRARVRIREDASSQSVDPPPGVRHFHPGEEVVTIQWGRKGYPVTRDSWWDSMDIDGAHILDAGKVDVIAILEEVLPE